MKTARKHTWTVKLLLIVMTLALVLPSFFLPSAAKAAEPVPGTWDNLASGKTPTVSLISGDAAQTAKEAAMMGRLTDDVLGDGDWNGHRTLYVDFYRNMGRHVYIDLVQLSTVKELRFRAMQDASAGIYLPQNVGFSLSNDGGATWSYLGSLTSDLAEPADAKHSIFKLDGLHYQADKVRISFPVDVWIFADELQILGTTGVVDGAVPPPAGDLDPYQEINAYPAPDSEQTRGASNDYLIYAGWHTNGTVRHDKTADMLLPAVAYLDADGSIKDFMFDSFTFLPYATSSANRSFLNQTSGSADKASTKADWQEYIDFLFDPQVQLAALNEAVGEAKEALRQPEYQAKVKIAIPNTSAVQTAFGEIGGTGLNFNAAQVGKETALANRVKASTWYVDQILQHWDEDAYPNLRLDGFYWMDESVHTYLDPVEEGVIKQSTAYVHSRGKLIYWIPYYQAPGFEKWKSLGFDYAVMQPNYAFQDVPVTRPTDTAMLAKRYGLGVEMELRNFRTDADRQKFIQYLYQGTTAGYMTGSVRAWYMGTLTLQEAYASKVPAEHEIYDMTYKSIKGTYPKTPEQLDANLAFGKVPVVSLVSGDPAQAAKETAMTGRLTDNVFGNGDWSRNRASYVDFYRNIARNVVIDLGQTSTVHEVSMRVMQDASAGIGTPANVYFSLSDDGGATWRFIGAVPVAQAEAVDAKHKLFKIGGLKYLADQVKISFDVSVWAFVDEIEVNGQKGVANGATQAPDTGYDDPYKEINAFPAPGSDQVRGTRNDLLIYAGWHTGGTVKEEKSVAKLLPGVAYLNREDEIKDWMYNSFTFLPYATGSSGRALATAPTAAASGTKADWQEYIDFLFDETNQLAALNEAVGLAKDALNQPDYQAKVKLTVPRPIPVQTQFGEVDGVTLNFSAAAVGDAQALANRAAAVKWYVDEVLRQWDPARYPNLRFDGFYWLHESIEVLPNNGEEELLKQLAAYIHEEGKMIYWIPFYQANGFYKWKELGFDYAILQPNYAFYASPDSRPTDAALLAKRFGLGLEMEIHWNGLTVESDRQKFLRYLDQGVTAGYMNGSVRAWYMGTETLQQAYASTVLSQREIYDMTYASIKGLYPDFPDHTAPVTTSAVPEGWQNTDQTVQLSASDDFSGVKATYASVDGEPTVEGQTVVTLTEEGKHTVQYYSVDHAGNQESVKLAEVWIDKTAPVIGQPGTLTFRQTDTIDLGIPFAETLSSVVEAVYTVDGITVGPVLTPLSLSVGPHALQVKVTDAAGNSAQAAFTLTVTVELDQLDEVIAIGASYGWIDNNGIANSLLAKVHSLQKKEGKGVKSLENEIRAQSGKHITEAFANLLLQDLAVLDIKD